MTENYDVKVYKNNNGDDLNVDSGGTCSIFSGGVLGLAGTDMTGAQLRKDLVSAKVPYEIVPVALATVLPTKNLPANADTVIIYGSATVVSASFWLTSCSAGRHVYLFLKGDSTGAFTNASTQIDVSLSGCTLLGSVGDALSGFEMHTSLASDCMVEMYAVADNVWAIVNQFGDIDE